MVRMPARPGGKPQRRGICPICSRDVPVTRDGMVSKVVHDDPVTRRTCRGLGEPAFPLPKESS